MKAFIGNITFQIDSPQDINLFLQFLRKHGDEKDLGPFTSTPNTFQPMAGANNRGDPSSANRRRLERRKRKREREKEERRIKTKSHKATYSQQQQVTYNPFIHQVTGVLRKGPVRFNKESEMRDFFEEKVKARQDFLQTNYSLLYHSSYHDIKYDECIDQLNQISYDYVNFKPRYNEQWYTGVKAIESGDTYLSTCGKTKAYINSLAFKSRPFVPSYNELRFTYLSQSIDGINVEMIRYGTTAQHTNFEFKANQMMEKDYKAIPSTMDMYGHNTDDWFAEKEIMINSFLRQLQYQCTLCNYEPELYQTLEKKYRNGFSRVESEYRSRKVNSNLSQHPK